LSIKEFIIPKMLGTAKRTIERSLEPTLNTTTLARSCKDSSVRTKPEEKKDDNIVMKTGKNLKNRLSNVTNVKIILNCNKVQPIMSQNSIPVISNSKTYKNTKLERHMKELNCRQKAAAESKNEAKSTYKPQTTRVVQYFLSSNRKSELKPREKSKDK